MILLGLDGSYVIRGGKLLRIVTQQESPDWRTTTGGFIEYTLENGEKFCYGEKLNA
jgi:hypothetical protein